MSYEEIKPPERMPEPGFYHHYKHDLKKGQRDHAYYIYGVEMHTEDNVPPEERFKMVYRPLYEEALVYRIGKLFDGRPLYMFYEPALWQGREVERFVRITDPAIIAELKKVKAEMYPEE